MDHSAVARHGVCRRVTIQKHPPTIIAVKRDVLPVAMQVHHRKMLHHSHVVGPANARVSWKARRS